MKSGIERSSLLNVKDNDPRFSKVYDMAYVCRMSALAGVTEVRIISASSRAVRLRILDNAALKDEEGDLYVVYQGFDLGTFSQSLAKVMRPSSVRGCLSIFSIMSGGIVATWAPHKAASMTCLGWRMLATMTFESNP